MRKLDQNINNFRYKFTDKKVAIIAQTLFELATNSKVISELPNIVHDLRSLETEMGNGDLLVQEQALVKLYARLHSIGATYTFSEQEILRNKKGYYCHASGFWPLIRADHFIKPESIVIDLGAGNGLQGLLLQCLYPHRKTLQIEISSELIRIGRIFHKAIGICNERIEWINDDIVNVSLEEADFIYIYRPSKPVRGGNNLYESIAQKLASINKPIVIFSIADCLEPLLKKHFSIFYTDGHLTCFAKSAA